MKNYLSEILYQQILLLHKLVTSNSNPWILLFLASFTLLPSCKKETYVPVESHSNIRFQPYGIGNTLLFGAGSGYLGNNYHNYGVTDLCLTGQDAFVLAGFRTRSECVFVKKTIQNTLLSNIRMDNIPGYSIYKTDDPNAIPGGTLIPTNSGEVIFVPDIADSVLPILRLDANLQLKSVVYHDPFPGSSTRFNPKYLQYIEACSDAMGGCYIQFTYFSTNASSEAQIDRCFIHLDSRDSMISKGTVDEAWFSEGVYPSHLFLANKDQVIIVRSFGNIWSCNISDLLKGKYEPVWTRTYTYHPAYEAIAWGDSLLLATTDRSGVSGSNYFGALKLTLIDMNNGNAYWDKQFMLQEPEDKLTLALTANKNNFLLAYAANMDGRMLQVDHSGNLLSEKSIKGNKAKTRISKTGLCGDKAFIYGFTGRGNAQQLDCFEMEFSIK